MARLDAFIVKELSRGDHQTLLQITESFSDLEKLSDCRSIQIKDFLAERCLKHWLKPSV